MHFSSRTDFGAEADPLMEAVAARRLAGLPIVDLTDSNPTRCGLSLEPSLLLPPLTNEANQLYLAEPFGPTTTRQAIASEYYAKRGIAVHAADMMLTASTSEAYSFLFRLLCEPGDQVLVPQPSYPLFDLLAKLCDVETVPYPLRFHDRWQTDTGALEAAITARTRAIVVVHPNNPTGHFATHAERAELQALAARYNLPLLVDEVFLDYPVGAEDAGTQPDSFAVDEHPIALTFVMSGLSKVLALPQMKLAWTLVRGPKPLRATALARLEYIADTYLSVAAPGANAAGAWLRHADRLHATVRGRLHANLAYLDLQLAEFPVVSRLPVEGGWSVVLRIPATEPDGDFALRVLEQAGVLVHPGSFFGLAPRGWVVLSLLVQENAFQLGVKVLLKIAQSTADQVPNWMPENLSSNA